MTVLITIDEKGDWKTGKSEVKMVKSNDDLIANQKTVAWPTREYGKFPSDSGYGEWQLLKVFTTGAGSGAGGSGSWQSGI